VLVADKNTQFVIEGLLSRREALAIRPFHYDIYVHPHHDPGVYHQAPSFLEVFQNQYQFALVLLDKEGSGQEHQSVSNLAADLKARIEQAGWVGRVEVIVLEPELEVWAWVNSPHLARELGWRDLQELHAFVRSRGFWSEHAAKPERPKEAVETALRHKNIQRSSAIYKKIAERASFRSCRDKSFERFQTTLRNWFGQERLHET